MMRNNKRAATITTFILTIGLLAIGLVVIASLQKMTFYKASDVESSVLNSIVSEISRVANKAAEYPTNARYKLQINLAEEYKARINNGYITLNFTKKHKVITKKLLLPKVYIIPSEFSSSGKVYVYKDNNNILITNNLTCNPGDGICDPGCIIKEICDPDCYSSKRDGICNPYCLDKNGDGKINELDRDGICDPDCYSNVYKGAYDIDCIKSNDNICDPATNGIKDGICDSDCVKTNGICDPDCSEYDADCPHKDNGFCEPERGENCRNTKDCTCKSNQECRPDCKVHGIEDSGCINKSSLLQNTVKCDSSCQCQSNNCIFGYCCNKGEYFSTALSPPKCISFLDDGICNTSAPLSENCTYSPKDCNCTKEGLGECCVGCQGSIFDKGGCCPAGEVNCSNKCEKLPNPKYEEKHKCNCDKECDDTKDLYCSASKTDKNNKACCPKDKEWDGTKCKSKSCSPDSTPCYNKWWPNHYGPIIHMNEANYACDLVEVCQPKIRWIADEATGCCSQGWNSNYKLSQFICDEARSDAGINSPTDEQNPLKVKKCAGYYVILGFARLSSYNFMKNYYFPEIEGPRGGHYGPSYGSDCARYSGRNGVYYYPGWAGITSKKPTPGDHPIGWGSDTDKSKDTCILSDLPTHVDIAVVNTGICADYSAALTTALREVGYKKDEAMSLLGPGHGFDLIKFPGDKKYKIVDTTGNNANGFNVGGQHYYNNPSAFPNEMYCDYLTGGRLTPPPGLTPCFNDYGPLTCPSVNEVQGCT